MDPSELSTYQHDIRQQLNAKEDYEKLIGDLHPKKSYNISWINLAQALQLGVELISVKRVITFTTLPFLKSYMELNNNLRKQAKDELTGSIFKNYNNVIFGKMAESQANRLDIRVVRDAKKFEKHVSKFTCESWKAIRKDCAIVYHSKTEVNLTNNLAIGSTILDISKSIMINMVFNVLKPLCEDNHYRLKIAYSDTG